LGQQVSVRAATTLAGRIAAKYGTPFTPAEGLHFVFPEPEVLAAADLTSVGLVKARARAISGLAEAVANKRLCFESLEGLNNVVQALCALPGIGPWTAHYVAMRAYGEPDAFPGTDLGLRKAVGATVKELAT